MIIPTKSGQIGAFMADDGRKANPKPILPVPSGSRSLDTLDPLQRYLAEIQAYSILDTQEEREVARRYRDTEDEEAAYRLLTSNLRLVVKIAYEYRNYYPNMLDLIQEGNIGLMQAIKRYDPERGVKVSSYAQYWIRAYIIYFLLANHRLVKLGTTQAQRKLFFNLRKEQDRLIQMGYRPEPKLLAERLDVKEKTVREMVERMGSSELPLDAPQPSGEGRTLAEVLGDTADNPEDAVGDNEFRGMLLGKFRKFADSLEDERDIYIWHNRLMQDKPETLKSIGAHFGFSKERARQLEERLKGNFKAFLEEELGDTVELQTFVNAD